MLFSAIIVFCVWQSTSDTHLSFKVNALLINGTNVTLERALAAEVIVQTSTSD